MKPANKIDVHNHIFPKAYVEALRNAGATNAIGFDYPEWEPETTIKQMDKLGIRMAYLSISAPGVYFKGIEFPEGLSEKIARIGNEAIAGMKRSYPDRCGGFATIPLLNPRAAVEELSYALDTLKLDGVCLLTNYKGKYLGDESFDAFFKELDNRRAVVFIHPTDPGDPYDAGLDYPNALIDAPFDTTRAVANMLYNGTLDKYPHITFILSHGGGTIPYLAWRLASIAYGQKGKKPPVMRSLYDFLVKGEPDKGLHHLRRMYYDTANVSGSYAVKTLQEFAGPDHILFGTDLSISKLAGVITKNLKKDGDFSEEEYDKMAYRNAARLFASLQ